MRTQNQRDNTKGRRNEAERKTETEIETETETETRKKRLTDKGVIKRIPDLRIPPLNPPVAEAEKHNGTKMSSVLHNAMRNANTKTKTE